SIPTALLGWPAGARAQLKPIQIPFLTGPQGPQGPAGPAGPAGPQGPAGPPGPGVACTGNDATDIVMKVGPLYVNVYEASLWNSLTGGSPAAPSACNANG